MAKNPKPDVAQATAAPAANAANAAKAQLYLQELPPTAQRLVKCVGWGKAYGMIDKWGGTEQTVYVPKINVKGSDLAAEIGIKEALAISKEFGEGYLLIPSCKKAIGKARDRMICADLAAGLSHDKCALKYKVSRSTIKQADRRTKTPKTAPVLLQMDIFKDHKP